MMSPSIMWRASARSVRSTHLLDQALELLLHLLKRIAESIYCFLLLDDNIVELGDSGLKVAYLYFKFFDFFILNSTASSESVATIMLLSPYNML